MKKVEIHGHRGDRGHFPENSIPAFLSALQKGVDVLEMDVVISKDKQVVVSHEPFMASLYMLQPNGKSILKNEEKNFNLYQMDYEVIKQFDGGSKINPKFLQQQKIKTYKPLLSEVISAVENFIEKHQLSSVKYNIELKSEVEDYGIFQPEPEEFVHLVAQVLKDHQIENRVILQSFDIQILEEIHQQHPSFTLAYLVEDGEATANLKKLSFTPSIYSPHFTLVSSQKVKKLQQQKIKVIPWTVNTTKDLQQMMEFGVDGIISDYPELAINIRDHYL
ncbi:glycerophosphodiester phosphodiesterase family protein [Mesonia mobilis]|uniref:Glycerophosphoryl diester phosphodiesterase n=1 Tax=Mesonia mobilis TaxID=369791 RepID=A0ABQ3BLS6_9FLAO|nr:glycerophosphodiester phosphodiesterase family protein [Mesonia mobilis]GGZ45998.1 glycerophosphoryl diester phosphodiesterase [Mesonia mobilis]